MHPSPRLSLRLLSAIALAMPMPLFAACNSDVDFVSPSTSTTATSSTSSSSSSASSSSASTTGVGGSSDCPAEPQLGSACTSDGLLCDYGDQRCLCHTTAGLTWECLPAACPIEVFTHEPLPDSCTQVELACDVFEFTCTCVAPEMQWHCCPEGGPPPECPPEPADGELCCWHPGASTCSYPTEGGTITCECNDHFTCSGS